MIQIKLTLSGVPVTIEAGGDGFVLTAEPVMDGSVHMTSTELEILHDSIGFVLGVVDHMEESAE